MWLGPGRILAIESEKGNAGTGRNIFVSYNGRVWGCAPEQLPSYPAAQAIRTSFEDEEAARYLNDTFVCIKVDREERPDIDAVYMAACHMMNGSGGFIEVQGTAEGEAFSREEMDALLALAQKGIAELVELQKQVLSTPAAGGA